MYMYCYLWILIWELLQYICCSPWVVGWHTTRLLDWGCVAGQVPARRQLSDPYSPFFTQSFLSCFPCVLSPVVLLRLLLHRLLTTAAHLQRWKSCASRSSFASASAHEAPRSPRSRASSTDTEPSSLRKRRKVRCISKSRFKISYLSPGLKV